MTHCGRRGETLTKRKYMVILAAMEAYIDDFGRDDNATPQADHEADQIDRVSPASRTWSGTLSEKGYEKWHDVPHPRRYAFNENQRRIQRHSSKHFFDVSTLP
jgi:hypothetical protein